MTLSAFKLIDHNYAGPILLLLSIISSVLVSYSAWERWKKDFMYLAERQFDIPLSVSIFIIACESFLQFLVSIVSFWWISRVPNCIFMWYGIDRNTQAYVWLFLLFFVFMLHVILWKKSTEEMERLLKTTYEHLDTRGDIP